MNNANSLNNSKDITNPKETNFTQKDIEENPQNLDDLPNSNSDNIIPMNSSHQDEKSPGQDLSDENDENNKKQLKRRSKREVEGRNYICKLCSKSYLSYPALYTHYKQKHNTNNSSGRGRGRPKKTNLELNEEKNPYNPQNQSFFSKVERAGKTDPEKEINNCIDSAFNDLYNPEQKKRIDSRGINFYNSVEEHPFLSKFKQDPHDIEKPLGEEQQIADLVLIEYLNKMAKFCNPNYYVKLIKFVTLFREHVNLFHLDKNRENAHLNGDNNNNDYTEINNAEDVPDSSNEFITDFIDPEGKNEDLGYSKEECIDLTQNLCYWMYDNNFTCSKLSLINDKN